MKDRTRLRSIRDFLAANVISGWTLFGLVSLFYFLASLGNEFIYDDAEVILNERLGLSLHDLALLFSQRHYPFLPYYRPVTRLTFVIQKALHGPVPLYFHLGNALLAGLAALLIYWLCRCRAFRIERNLAFLAALIFAVHPLTSSLVYPSASGRETLLPFALMVLGLLVYLGEGKNSVRNGFVIAVLALFSKESGIILPVLYLAADWTGVSAHRPDNLRGWARRYMPYAAVVVVYVWIRWLIFGGGEWRWNGDWRLVAGSFLYAIQSSCMPAWELHFEPMSISAWFTPLRTSVSLLLLGLILYTLARRKDIHSRRIMAFWGAVAFFGILPTANLLMQDAFFSERYVIPALLSLIIAAALAVQPSRSRRIVVALGALAAVMLAGSSWQRSKAFRDNLAFCSQWVKTSPGYFLPYYNLARSYELAGRREEAREPYLKSIELNPRWPSSYLNLASLEIAESRFVDALRYIDNYLSLEPGSARGWYTAGVAAHGMGDLQRAVSSYERAVEIDPRFLDAIINLGVVYYQLGEAGKARDLFTQALRIDPGNANAKRNLSFLN